MIIEYSPGTRVRISEKGLQAPYYYHAEFVIQKGIGISRGGEFLYYPLATENGLFLGMLPESSFERIPSPLELLAEAVDN